MYKNENIAYGIGGVVIGILLASVFTPMLRSGGFGMMNWRNTSAPVRQVTGNAQMANTIDQHFIEQMIPHHEGAIAMANLALAKATHPEIITLATAIIAAQTAEIESMRSWYSTWFGRPVPSVNTTGMMGGGMMSQNGMHMGGQEDMSALENATDFDTAFIEQMIPHHQLAIMMASMLQSGTVRPEMHELAKNIISSQSQEIQQMQTWYAAWNK